MKRIELNVILANEIKELNKQTAKKSVDLIIDELTKSLISGEGAEVRGFGSFSRRNKASRIGINPKTGDKTSVPAKKIPFFKPGKNLKEVVNNL